MMCRKFWNTDLLFGLKRAKICITSISSSKKIKIGDGMIFFGDIIIMEAQNF